MQLEDIEVAWYRKGRDWLSGFVVGSTVPTDTSPFATYVGNRLKEEDKVLQEYIHFLIRKRARLLGSPNTSTLNKLQILHLAKDVGLNVPDFFVSNQSDKIRELASNSSPFITKAMSDCIYYFDVAPQGIGYFSYTEDVTQGLLDGQTDHVSASFVQHKIAKKFDIRAFVLVENVYSMAILSQADEMTKTDFRRYNEQTPNRCIPFEMPGPTAQRLLRLFATIGLTTGSADFVIDENDQLYFLEINPVGQFGMVSRPCNYHLEKLIARHLLGLRAGTSKEYIEVAA